MSLIQIKVLGMASEEFSQHGRDDRRGISKVNSVPVDQEGRYIGRRVVDLRRCIDRSRHLRAGHAQPTETRRILLLE